MRLLYDYYPILENTNSVTITGTNFGSSVESDFNISNLYHIDPTRCVKSNSTTESSLTFEFGFEIELDMIFINRVNFSECTIEYVKANSSESVFLGYLNFRKDEVEDEEYAHAVFYLNKPISAKKIKITVPSNKTLFNDSYYKIGNVFIGKSVEMINPKNGFTVTYKPKIAVTEFKSGYTSVSKLGRTRRSFNGTFDKVSKDILNKIKMTFKPVVIYLDFNDDNSCYICRCTEDFKRNYEFAKVQSLSFVFEEIV